MGHARALAGIEDLVFQLYAFKEVLKKGLSVRQTETLVKQGQAKTKSPSGARKLPLAYQKLQDRLASNLSVQIKPKKDGSGEIAIYFHNDDDLERLSEFLES